MTVIVAGGSGCLGFETFNYLKEKYTDIWIIDLKKPKNLKSENFVQCNVFNEKKLYQALKKSISYDTKFLYLVNFVGKIHNAPFFSLMREEKYLSKKEFDSIMEVNLGSTFIISKEYLRICNELGFKCNLINISSISSLGSPGQISYSTSKLAIEGFTRSLAMELGPLGHRFNCISPGYFDVETTRTNLSKSKMEKIKEKISLKSFGEVDSIAKAILYIFSDNYINGQVLRVDGGIF